MLRTLDKMNFITVFYSYVAAIAIAKAATIPKISELLHDINVNGNKLNIRTKPQGRYDLISFPVVFKTLGTNAKLKYKIKHPTTLVTEQPILYIMLNKEPDFINPTIVNHFEVNGENLNNETNINSGYVQKTNEENFEINFENNNETNDNEIQTADPVQNTENIDVNEPTEANQSKIDHENYNVGNGDEKEFIFINGFGNDFSLEDSVVEPTALRLKRSANVIEEENQSTTVSGHKLHWNGRDAYNMIFKNINS